MLSYYIVRKKTMKNIFRGLTVNKMEEANIVLVGIPYDQGCSCGSGAHKAPDVIRNLSSFLPPLTMDGKEIKNIKIFDNGNVDVRTPLFYEKLESYASFVFELGKFPLFIGGDHSISISLEKAFLRYAKEQSKVPVIIHIDAHPDICDIYHDSSYSHACPNRRAIDNGYQPQNIVMVGIRGFEKQEVEYFEKHPEIKVYLASFLNEGGYQEALTEIKERFNDDKYMIYLSYDIDANDPSFAPGTGTPEAFGLNSYELMKFIKELFTTLPIFAMDIVEVSPELDCNDITSWLALKTLYEIFEIIGKKEVK